MAIMSDPRDFEALLDDLFEGVYVVDRERRITYWNKAAERITGFAREQVTGRMCRDGVLCHIDDSGTHLCADGCPLAATMDDRQRRNAHVFVLHAQGHRVPVRIASAPLLDAAGEVVGAVESFFEDAEWRESVERAEQLAQFAFTDTLTGLPNRRHMEQRLEAKLAELDRYGWPFGVVLADVDHFKAVNDTLGHDTGDLVLQMVARALGGGVRGFDVVGRWGGEEFLVVAQNASPEALLAIANRLRILVAGSVLRERGDLKVTISAGIAAARRGEPLEALLKRADRNLYRAKENGRNAVGAVDV